MIPRQSSEGWRQPTLDSAMREYYAMPKEFLSADEDRLQMVFDTIHHKDTVEALVVSANCQIELALMRDSGVLENVDQRLGEIDDAEGRLSRAEELWLMRSESGLNPSFLYRIRLHRLFTPIYRDLVAGEVTSRTLEDAFRQVRQQLGIVSDIFHNGSPALNVRDHDSDFRGLLSELEVLCLGLKYADMSPIGDENLIMVPAAPRADNGGNYPAFSHDVSVLRVQQYYREETGCGFPTAFTHIHEITPLQVKTNSNSPYTARRDYHVSVVHIDEMVPLHAERRFQRLLINRPRTKRNTMTDDAYAILLLKCR